jgi:exonuclease VII small subunit
LEYVSTKEYERGHASGYSQACDHMLKVLDQLVSEVKSEFTMLETAIEEFKSVQNLVGEGEEEVPLD